MKISDVSKCRYQYISKYRQLVEVSVSVYQQASATSGGVGISISASIGN